MKVKFNRKIDNKFLKSNLNTYNFPYENKKSTNNNSLESLKNITKFNLNTQNFILKVKKINRSDDTINNKILKIFYKLKNLDKIALKDKVNDPNSNLLNILNNLFKKKFEKKSIFSSQYAQSKPTPTNKQISKPIKILEFKNSKHSRINSDYSKYIDNIDLDINKHNRWNKKGIKLFKKLKFKI